MSIDFTKPVPLYQQIADDIKQKIAAGKLKVGDRLGSHRTLAQTYGVSLIVVKQALTELIRAEILYARVGKGTFVARATEPVNLQQHKSIGIVLRQLDIPFFSQVVQFIEDEAYKAGYNMLLSMSAGRRDKEEAQLDHFQQIGVDGLIIASMDPGHQASPAVQALHAAGVPYVHISYVEERTYYMVGTDNEHGAFLATEHLIQQGYQRIGYLGGERFNRLSALRQKGYQRALEMYGLPYDPSLVYNELVGPGWQRQRSGLAFGKKIAQAANRPDAFFVYNDVGALAMQEALLGAGLHLPDDMGLVGFDDIERAAYVSVPLTTIRQPVRAIAQEAFATLLKRIAHQPAPVRTVLKPELVVRASSVRIAEKISA